MAREIGADPAFVIAATHGKRAIDNLAHFKPHLRAHELSAAMDEFERSILFYADAHTLTRECGAAGTSTHSLLSSDAGSSSGLSSTTTSSCVSSLVQSAATSTEQLVVISGPRAELEAAAVDRALRVLPGVKALLASIPEGRYAIATSGAKTYGTLIFPPPYPRGFCRD